MSIMAKISNFFGLEDDEYMEEEQVPQQKPVAQAAANMEKQPKAFQPRKQPVAPKEQSAGSLKKRTADNIQPDNKVVSMHQVQLKQQTKQAVSPVNESKIKIVEPRVYSEAMVIAKSVLEGESVLVNFRLLEEFQARRVVDFLTGTVYAEDGDIKRVADEIFLCTPKGTEIDGTEKELVDSSLFEN